MPSVAANRHPTVRSAQIVAWRKRRGGGQGYNLAGAFTAGPPLVGGPVARRH